MRRVLLHIYNDDCFEARFQVALDIARRCAGRITCVQAVPYDYGMPGDFYGTMSAQMVLDYGKIAEETKQEIEGRLANEGVPWNWVWGSGSAVSLIARHSPMHDVVIVGSDNPLGKAETPSRLVAELIERVRSAVLVVPKNVRSFDFEVPAAIAWNGSAECAHALRAAMPALSLASSIHILCVREEKDSEKFDLPSTEAAEYLAQHDLNSEITELPREKSVSVAQTLCDAAKARNAGYLVMGGYGHSRFQERVLGGVTRDMLRSPTIPLLLSH